MTAQDAARKALAAKTRLASRLPGLLSRVAGRPVSTQAPEALSYTPLFIWERDICQIALRKSEKFAGSTLLERMTRYEPAYWSFNGFNLPYKERFISSCWLMPDPGASLLCVFFYHQEAGGQDVEWATKSSCTIGDPIPPQLTSIIAMREFLNLRLAADEPVLLPRNERRLLAKHRIEVPEVRLISLRLKEPSGWHSEAARRYRHRWITSGHWRRLQEPLKRDSKRSGGKAGDEVVWVVPHEKGPAGAPLLARRPTVMVVHR